MFHPSIDARELVRHLTDVEKRQFPVALTRALNDTAFQVRTAWRDEMSKVFDRPTALTLNAVLYRKASVRTLRAEVFIRNEAAKGTPPARYLVPQVEGGGRGPKRSEVLLRSAGILAADEYWVPGRSAPLDAYGNLPGRTVRTILSDLQASFDTTQHSTVQSRRKRARRRAIGRREVYFYSRGPSGNRGDGRPQHLKRGIYGRTQTAFGSSIRLVMHIVKSVRYTNRYDVYGLAERLFNERFDAIYRRWMTRLGQPR